MTPGLLPALAAAALAAAPQGSTAQLPFEELGGALLDAAGAPAPTGSESASSFLALLEPLYLEVHLGGVRLWIPRKALRKDGSLGKALDPRDGRDWARELLELQRGWMARLGFDDEDRAEREAAVGVLERWVESFGSDALPEPGPELDAARSLLARTFADTVTHTPTPIAMIAPTRAHFIAIFGAAGLAMPLDRNRLWDPGLRNHAFSALSWEALVVALDRGTEEGSGVVSGERFEDERVVETVVHRVSHMLSARMVPDAPDWLHEGLALRDTIVITGDDDSVCTGFSRRERIRPGVAVFEWIDANMSPYREGPAARWFEAELRPNRDGLFVLHDLQKGGPVLSVPGPFLSDNAVIPQAVRAGGVGLQQGYAEFYRAYSGTFVQWLSLQRTGDREVLAWLLEYLHREQGAAHDHGEPAAVGLRMITFKTLGQSDDPERDLEAAFAVWLATR